MYHKNALDTHIFSLCRYTSALLSHEFRLSFLRNRLGYCSLVFDIVFHHRPPADIVLPVLCTSSSSIPAEEGRAFT